ncbi:MAG: restriction endonuclease, partial [bacterium]
SNLESQRLEDFQPLCKAANDVKRQICKRCKESNIRWNAKNIKGNPYPFYKGDEDYTNELGCVGCYQYDPVEYRKACVQRISKEVTEDIMKKLYPED